MSTPTPNDISNSISLAKCEEERNAVRQQVSQLLSFCTEALLKLDKAEVKEKQKEKMKKRRLPSRSSINDVPTMDTTPMVATSGMQHHHDISGPHHHSRFCNCDEYACSGDCYCDELCSAVGGCRMCK